VAVCLGLAAGAAHAQNASQVTVSVRGGQTKFDRAASLDPAVMLGLDTFYGVNKWLSIGPVLSLTRPNTTGADFISVISYGVLNLGDTTSFFKASQPVSVLDAALNVRVQLPGKKLSPYATGGIGGYAMFMDIQSNRGERHKTGVAFNVGAGVLWALSDRAGITADVRSTTYTDYDRVALDPRFQGAQINTTLAPSKVEQTLFAENFKPAPKAKSTVTNFTFAFGFSYVPAFFGTGGGQ
jgi:hypothetical protein